MKGRNHVLMAGSLALLLNLHPLEILYCAAAANLPDQLERVGRVRIIKHRTLTHEVLLWLVPLLVFLYHPIPMPTLPLEFLSAHSVGLERFSTFRSGMLFLPGLLHLAGDVLTPRGVLVAGRKVSAGLFQTGHPLEYLVTGVLVAAAILSRTI